MNLQKQLEASFPPIKVPIILEEPEPTRDEEVVEEYMVESILRRKKVGEQYLWQVKWQGYDDTSWEPESCFISEDGTRNDIWDKYEQHHPKKRGSTTRLTSVSKRKKLKKFLNE